MHDDIKYWYAINSEKKRQVSLSELKALFSSGEITYDTYVWKNGMESWITLENCLELIDILTAEKTDSISKNSPDIVDGYLKPARQGNAFAQLNLASCFYFGEGIGQNKQEAFNWYRKAAEQGNIEAQYNLGVCYDYGEGISANKQEAINWYTKAAQQGHAEAKKMLDICIKSGSTPSGQTTLNYETSTSEKLSKSNVKASSFNMKYLVYTFLSIVCIGIIAGVYFLWKVIDENNLKKEVNDYINVFSSIEARNNQSSKSLKNISHNRVKLWEKAAKKGWSDGQIMYAYYLFVNNNQEKAFEFFQKAANQSNTLAFHNMGDCYANGTGVGQNYKEAFRWYMKAAEKGRPLCQLKVARYYEQGLGTSRNQRNAIIWYQKAAEHKPYHNLAISHIKKCREELVLKDKIQEYMKNINFSLNDDSLSPVTKKALIENHSYWLKAADKGWEEGQYLAGVYYISIKNYKRAIYYLKKAANQGYTPALYDLGILYYNGLGMNQDYKEAFKYFNKAAMKGHMFAQNNLGACYFNGQGTSQSYEKAIYFYEKAAQQGCPLAQVNLGDCYYNGIGVSEDYTEAVKWYRRAAQNDFAKAQLMYGLCCFRGHGVKSNKEQAFQWIKKSAEHKCIEGQYYLGLCYADGLGTQRSIPKAVEWLLKAASKNDVSAMTLLARIYMREYKNNREAVKWFQEAAKSGYAEAQTMLAAIYFDGNKEIKKNHALAVYWALKATKQGSPAAMCLLGVCYYDGSGVKKDQKKGLELIKLASQKGNKLAIELLNKFNSQ